MIDFIHNYPLYQIALLALVALCTLIQLFYWLRYSRVATHRHQRHNRPATDTPPPPVSVIVVVADDPAYILEHLPKLLTQNHPQYEVVVVDDGAEENLTNELTLMQAQYPHLRYTTIQADPTFQHSRKLALTVGVKAAHYENVIFTDSDAVPTSEKWLSIMARGFQGGEIVIGYTGIEHKPGAANRIMRCQRLTSSIRYLSAAIGGKPYRGIYNNLGYTRSLFFDNRGFTHLRMTLGEDDLFIQKVVEDFAPHTSVMLNPQATVRQFQWGGLSRWRSERKYRTSSFSYYPLSVRFSISLELATRLLLVLGAIAMLILGALGMPLLWAVAGGAFLLRELTMTLVVRAITRRLGERKLMWSYLIHDLVAPINELILWVNRELRPSPRLWL